MANSTVYEALGLTRNPFPPTPDAASYFFTPRLEEEFAEIRHCIEARKGFVLLTGEVGLGKSTLVRRLLDTLPSETCQSALILNTFLQDSALLSAIQSDFGLSATQSLDQGLAQLTDFLLKQHQENKISLLVIDDAQNLTIESLELVRLLCNLETDQEKLLQILLVGQPELESTLAKPQLRQLKSRIVKHTRLTGLHKEELARYFDFRINAAQAAGRFSIQPAAVNKLYQATHGNLRQIHLVLDRCLYGLASARQTIIDLPLVRRAIADIPSLETLTVNTNSNLKNHQRRVGWLGGMLVGTAAIILAAWNWPSSPAVYSPNVPASIEKNKPETTANSHLDSVQKSCEQQLKSIANSEDILLSHQLPSEIVNLLKPSTRLCISTVNGQAWATWLSHHQIEHIKAAEKTTRQIQVMLKNMGFLSAQAPDGLFGQKTAEALSKFQQEYRLSPTGQPDNLTFLLLENLNAPAH